MGKFNQIQVLGLILLVPPIVNIGGRHGNFAQDTFHVVSRMLSISSTIDYEGMLDDL